jgi:photosystem II stability/assembly factor-like uncharacterized protein
MKKLSFVFFAVVVFSFTSIFAQPWEKIGWDGGGTAKIVKAGGKLFVASEYDGVYTSDQTGDNWTPFNTGLPNYYTDHNSADLFVSKNYLLYISHDSTLSRTIYRSSASSANWQHVATPGPSGTELKDVAMLGGDSILVAVEDLFAFDQTTAGIYLSPDGGNSWSQLKQGLPGLPVNVRFAATDRAICLYADIFDTLTFDYLPGSLYRSPDRGKTWVKAVTGLPDTFAITNFASNGLVFVASVDAYIDGFPGFAGIFRSANGILWQPAPTGLDTLDNSTFALFTIDSMFFLNMFGAYKSIDQGVTWIPILDNESRLYNSGVITSRGIFLSSDGTLSVASDALTATTSLTPASKGIQGFASSITFASEKGVYGIQTIDYLSSGLLRSMDNGAAASWEYPLFSSAAFEMSFAPWIHSGTTYYAGGHDIAGDHPLVLASSDLSGNLQDAWTPRTALPGDGFTVTLDVSGDTILAGTSAIEGSKGFVYISTDDGSSWKGITPSVASNEEFSKVKLFGSAFYVVDQQGTLRISGNGGTSWSIVHSGIDSGFQAKAFAVQNGKLIVAGNVSKGSAAEVPSVYMTADNSSWQKIGTGYDTKMYISDLASDGTSLYLVSDPAHSNPYHRDYSQIYRSADGGLTWKQLGDNVIDGRRITVGGEYIFATGEGGGYRFAKPAGSVRRADAKDRAHLSIVSVYPNPANIEANISYSVPERSNVTVALYDMTGRRAATLADEEEEAGLYESKLDPQKLASGAYILEITASGERAMRVVQIVK